MIDSSVESRFQAQQVFWLGIVIFASLIMGYYLAANNYMLFLMFIGVAWLALLPFHARLSIILSVATFGSALIMPFFPGRPFLWEFAALLGWSGLIITISLRKYAPDYGESLRQNKWLFIGIAGYCAVLIVTMYFRGFGLRILGGEQMGGRYYFQQLTCAIFPLLFIMCRPEEKTLARLFIFQCILTTSYLVSDFVFSFAPRSFYVLLQFFELPGDAVNFELQSQAFGIRRFQSLNIVAQGLFFLLLVNFRLRDFFSVKGMLLIPLSVAILGMGLLSGHRYLVMIVTITLLFCVYVQRFFTARNVVIAGLAGIIGLVFIYAYADRMPLAAQRTISFLPAVPIETVAKADGAATFETRRILREQGLLMIPQYLLLGRGFGVAAVDYSFLWDPTQITWHLNQGRFFNGIIGLLVNTGLFGTIFMFTFIGAGTGLAWRTMTLLRILGCEDTFTRVSCVASSLWMANIISFMFLHGDSEFAMKTFSLQAAMLLACNYKLQQRYLALNNVE